MHCHAHCQVLYNICRPLFDRLRLQSCEQFSQTAVFHLAISNMAQRHVAFCERHVTLHERHESVGDYKVKISMFNPPPPSTT